MKTRLIYCFVFCLAMPFGLTAGASGFSVEDAYMRAMPPGRTATAAYLSVTNNHDKACAIIGGATEIAARLEVHQQLMNDGMMRMRPVTEVTVAAGETLLLQPGGFHLMLLDVEAPLVPGETHKMSLQTKDCGAIEVTAEVRSLFKKPTPAAKAHDHSMHGHSMDKGPMDDHSGHNMEKNGMHK